MRILECCETLTDISSNWLDNKLPIQLMKFRPLAFLIISLIFLILSFFASESLVSVEPGLHAEYIITAYYFRYVIIVWALLLSFLYFRSSKRATSVSKRFFITHSLVTLLPVPFVYFSMFVYPFVAYLFNHFVSNESLKSFYYVNEGIWIGFVVAQVFFAVILIRSFKIGINGK